MTNGNVNQPASLMAGRPLPPPPPASNDLLAPGNDNLLFLRKTSLQFNHEKFHLNIDYAFKTCN